MTPPMTPERWREVKAVVGQALDVPPAERAAWLARACGADVALRAEAESLLAAAEEDSVPGALAAIAAAARSLGESDSVAAEPEGVRRMLEQALGHQYEVLRPLGHGGMGAVYLARETALERFVAIKVLRPDLAGVAGARERFRREARIAAQLSHPGILPLYTFGEVGGMWYFVMGYVRGRTLAQRLRMEGTLPCGEAARILGELADALECAHRHGVVHRDIKPSNILLDEETGRAVLADFGIARVAGGGDSLTLTGAVMGTPHYMSPEQARGAADVDERSDLYSLGVVGYALLAGEEPFAGASPAELAVRRETQDPTPLGALAPAVPEDLVAVVMRCLAREPARRWASAHELREALARTACEPAPPEPLRDLPGFGPYTVAWASAWGAVAMLGDHEAAERALLLLIALLVPVGLALHVWNVGRHGLSDRELARVAFWPPEWWGMWWPRALRRPGDLWTRLPWPARLVRLAMSAFFVVLPALILVRRALDAEPARRWLLAAEGAIVVLAGAVVVGALRWARRRGLSLAESVHVLLGATVPSPTWRAPHVEPLLAPAARGIRAPAPDAPIDHVRAIGELAATVRHDAAREATRAARSLLAGITRLDEEIATLARDATAAEIDRLGAQLGALDAAPAHESRERRELRELVRHQLELVRRMRGRLEVASGERVYLLDLLRGLWAQLGALHDAVAAAAPVEPHAGRVRALCAEAAAALPDRARGVALPDGAPSPVGGSTPGGSRANM